MNRWFIGILLVVLCGLPQMAAGQLLRGASDDAGHTVREVFSNKAAREQLHIVGSSSMRHLTDAVARHFVAETKGPPPLVRHIGTRAGIRSFCAGKGPDFPDIVAASRRMTRSEFNACDDNGVKQIIELQVGMDAIGLVGEAGDPVMNLTPRHIYLALAAEVPRDFVLTANVSREVVQEAMEAIGEDFVENPFERWNQIDSNLPDTEIRVYGPSSDSGTLDFVNRQVLEAGCRRFKAVRGIYTATDRVRQCTTLRRKPYYNQVDEPFDDNVIAAILGDGYGTVGFVTFDTFEREREKIEPITLLGQIPTSYGIATGDYPLRRTVYYYVKREHMLNKEGVGVVASLRDFMKDLVSEEVIGPDGLLDKIGLVPLPEEERVKTRLNASTLRVLTR